MSKELRTPLNAIMGFTQLMEIYEPNNKNISKTADEILSASDFLLSLINEILDFSKIEAGKMNLESKLIDIEQLIEEVITIFSKQAKEKNIVIEHEIVSSDITYFKGDILRIRQVLINLVSNAVKFTQDGTINITVNLEELMRSPGLNEQNAKLKFAVSDDGIGISPEKQQTIFDAFEQEDNTTSRKYGGIGLGLSISKKLVELMGGQIGLSSEKRVGTTFFFTIKGKIPTSNDNLSEEPVNVKQRSNPLNVEETINEKFPLKILVAEDNMFNKMLIEKLLNKFGYDDFLHAENGVEVMSLLETNKVDIILMDIQMPVLDGYETTRAIRSSTDFPERKRNIPIIAMTAHVLDGVAEKCLYAGMNDSISKPVNLNVLNQKIRMVLNMRIESTQPEAISKNESTQLINLENLKTLTRNNPVKLKKYVDMFLKNIPVDLKLLNEHNDSKNWTELKKIAHKIKGNLGYMGVTTIEGEIVYLEQLDEVNANEEEINSKVKVVEKEIMLILIELKGLNF